MLKMWELLEGKGMPMDERGKYMSIAMDLGYAFADLDRVQIRADARREPSLRGHRAAKRREVE